MTNTVGTAVKLLEGMSGSSSSGALLIVPARIQGPNVQLTAARAAIVSLTLKLTNLEEERNKAL